MQSSIQFDQDRSITSAADLISRTSRANHAGRVLHKSSDSAGADKVFNALMQSGQASRDVAYYVAQVKYALEQTEFGDALTEKNTASEREFFSAFRLEGKKKEEKK